MKQRLGESMQIEDNNEVIQKLRMELETMERSKNEQMDQLKLQHENALKEMTKKCEIIEQRLQESNSRCEQFQKDILDDKQSMISISNQHKQVWLFDIFCDICLIMDDS